MSATPRPWSVDNMGTILDANGNDTHVETWGHRDVQALVLKAVNAHDALVELLDQCVRRVEFCLKQHWDYTSPEGRFAVDTAITQARALLDSLEPGGPSVERRPGDPDDGPDAS